MYAHHHNDHYQHFGDQWWVELHGLPDPIHLVQVSVAPDGTSEEIAYWGWIEAAGQSRHRQDGRPGMIWRHRVAFDAQFTYGPDLEVGRGRGRVVLLLVERAGEPASP